MDATRLALTISAGGIMALGVACASSSDADRAAPAPTLDAAPAEPAEPELSAEEARIAEFMNGLEQELMSANAAADWSNASATPAWADDALSGTGATTTASPKEETDDTHAIGARETTTAPLVEPGPSDLGVEPDESDEPGLRPLPALDPEPQPSAGARYGLALDDLASLTRERAFDPETAETGFTTGVRLAMLRALGWAGDTDNTIGLSDTERDALKAWSGAMERLGSALDAGAALPIALGEAMGPIVEISDEANRLRARSLALCERVLGFGAYKTLPRDGLVSGAYRFRAGRTSRAVVYVELEGLATRTATRRELGNATGVESVLRQRVDLYFDGTDRLEPGGDLVVWTSREKRVIDFCRSERRDFFTVQVIDLPPTLSVGRYRLKLTVEDEIGGRVAEAVVAVEVVAG